MLPRILRTRTSRVRPLRTRAASLYCHNIDAINPIHRRANLGFPVTPCRERFLCKRSPRAPSFPLKREKCRVAAVAGKYAFSFLFILLFLFRSPLFFPVLFILFVFNSLELRLAAS